MKRFSITLVVSTLLIASGIVLVSLVVSRQQRRIQPHSVAEAETHDLVMSDDLGQFITLLNAVESEEDPRYRTALERLRAHSTDVISEAQRLLSPAPYGLADNCALRHSVVLAVAALRNLGALDLLSEVALNPQPLPPVEAPMARGLLQTDPEHRLDTEAVVQRTIVALDAIEGIEALAGDGHSAALDALVTVSAAASNAVRAAALTALGTRPEWREHRDRAMAALPDDLRHLAHLSRKAVTEVPQIRDPRVTLLGAGNATIPAPGLGGDSSLRRTSVPGAPRAGRR
jgi:hypothetical protein